MTLPYERTRAVLRTGDFLKNLLDPKLTPGVPSAIRQRAAYLFKHYPLGVEWYAIARAAPEVFDEYQVSLWDRAQKPVDEGSEQADGE